MHETRSKYHNGLNYDPRSSHRNEPRRLSNKLSQLSSKDENRVLKHPRKGPDRGRSHLPKMEYEKYDVCQSGTQL